jgi:hypothetical protein
MQAGQSSSSNRVTPLPATYQRIHNQVLRGVYLGEGGLQPVTIQRLHFRLTVMGSDQCRIEDISEAVDDLVAPCLLHRDGDTVLAPPE